MVEREREWGGEEKGGDRDIKRHETSTILNINRRMGITHISPIILQLYPLSLSPPSLSSKPTADDS